MEVFGDAPDCQDSSDYKDTLMLKEAVIPQR